jgi:hypothetical protein
MKPKNNSNKTKNISSKKCYLDECNSEPDIENNINLPSIYEESMHPIDVIRKEVKRLQEDRNRNNEFPVFNEANIKEMEEEINEINVKNMGNIYYLNDYNELVLRKDITNLDINDYNFIVDRINKLINIKEILYDLQEKYNNDEVLEHILNEFSKEYFKGITEEEIIYIIVNPEHINEVNNQVNQKQQQLYYKVITPTKTKFEHLLQDLNHRLEDTITIGGKKKKTKRVKRKTHKNKKIKRTNKSKKNKSKK